MRHHLGLLLALISCTVFSETTVLANDTDAVGTVTLGAPGLDPFNASVIKIKAHPTMKAGQAAGWAPANAEACYFVDQANGYTLLGVGQGVVAIGAPPGQIEFTSPALANSTYDIWVVWKFERTVGGQVVDFQRIGSAFTSQAVALGGNPTVWTLGGTMTYDALYPFRSNNNTVMNAQGKYTVNAKWRVGPAPVVSEFVTIPTTGGLVRSSTATRVAAALTWSIPAANPLYVPSALNYNTYVNIGYEKDPAAAPPPAGNNHVVSAIAKNK